METNGLYTVLCLIVLGATIIIIRKNNKNKALELKLDLLYDLTNNIESCRRDILKRLIDAPLKIFDGPFASRVTDYFFKFIKNSASDTEVYYLARYISELNDRNNYLLGRLVHGTDNLDPKIVADIYVAVLKNECESKNIVFREAIDFLIRAIGDNNRYDVIIRQLHNIISNGKISPEVAILIRAEIVKIEKFKAIKSSSRD